MTSAMVANCYTMCGLCAGSKLCKTPVNSNYHTPGSGSVVFKIPLLSLSAATTLSSLGV